MERSQRKSVRTQAEEERRYLMEIDPELLRLARLVSEAHEALDAARADIECLSRTTEVMNLSTSMAGGALSAKFYGGWVYLHGRSVLAKKISKSKTRGLSVADEQTMWLHAGTPASLALPRSPKALNLYGRVPSANHLSRSPWIRLASR